MDNVDQTRASSNDNPNALNLDADPVLRIAGIEKSFRRGFWPRRREIKVLRGIGLEIGPGELIGLVGENGSGKSTLMKIIVGLLDRDAGRIELSGSLGYCPQIPLLWEKLTIDEHFELFARAYDLGKEEGTRSADELLKELRFTRYRGYRIEELSGGTRQKLNLALALMHTPDLLLLDEPYSGFLGTGDERRRRNRPTDANPESGRCSDCGRGRTGLVGR